LKCRHPRHASRRPPTAFHTQVQCWHTIPKGLHTKAQGRSRQRPTLGNQTQKNNRTPTGFYTKAQRRPEPVEGRTPGVTGRQLNRVPQRGSTTKLRFFTAVRQYEWHLAAKNLAAGGIFSSVRVPKFILVTYYETTESSRAAARCSTASAIKPLPSDDLRIAKLHRSRLKIPPRHFWNI
jgi:hypothetical protein